MADVYSPVVMHDERLACGRGMTDCEVVGISGNCGPDCPVLLDGKCDCADEMTTPTTYPATHERPVTRAEIDRLTAIIARLNEALDVETNAVLCLAHDLELQTARAEVAEALVRRVSEQRG